MDPSEKRIVGSLILLLGLTMLVAGFASGQLNYLLEFLKEVFEAAVSGAP